MWNSKDREKVKKVILLDKLSLRIESNFKGQGDDKGCCLTLILIAANSLEIKKVADLNYIRNLQAHYCYITLIILILYIDIN